MRELVLATALAITIGTSCGSKEPSGQEAVKKGEVSNNLIRIQSPTNGRLFSLGETIKLAVSPTDTLGLDSIVVSFSNNRVGAMDGLTHSITTDGYKLGNHTIRATAWRNGARQTASVGVALKSDTPPKQLRYRVVNSFPHDPEAYTQGLFFHNGYLIESTGQRGSSTLRRVELETGKVTQSVNLDRRFFGEGAAIHNGQIYQLTWTSHTGFVYDAETFEQIRTFGYTTQGWGLTNLGDNLVMTDGSNIMYIMEPESFTEVGRIEVYDDRGPVNQLNELELIDGKIWANVFMTEKIVIINPETGMVEATIDFTGILPAADRHRNIDVFNGIAWDKENRRIFVTGKNWPSLFEVEVY